MLRYPFLSRTKSFITNSVNILFMDRDQYKSSLGSSSLHLMDEPSYLNPKCATEQFQTRENHISIDDQGRKKYDIIVIGGGAGISKISSPSSRQGYKVAYIERGRNGGTCLNRGCIPSKMARYFSLTADTIRHSEKYLIHDKGFTYDFEANVVRFADEIDSDSFSIDPALKKNPNVDWYHASGKFVDDHTIECDGDLLTADRIFLAVGARPSVPPIENIDNVPYLTSTEALRLTDFPESIVIVGASYIACEAGFYFAGLGSKVHMVVRSKMLRTADLDISTEFQKIWLKEYPDTTHLSTIVTKVTYDETTKKFTSHLSNGTILETDQFMVASGVVPNTDLLGLEAGKKKFGIQCDASGYISVDDRLRTTTPNVWALGDCIGKYLFRHNANWEGEYLFRNIMYPEAQSPGGKNSLLGKEEYPAISYYGMPSAVFTSHESETASVGETEQEIIARGAKYISVKNPYIRSAFGQALRSESGFVKLLVERGTRKILGCHIIGYQASVLLHQVVQLFYLPGGPILDHLLNMIYIHPSLSELIRNTARRAKDQLLELGDPIPIEIRFK